MKRIILCLLCITILLSVAFLTSCTAGDDKNYPDTYSEQTVFEAEDDVFILCCEASDVLICANSSYRSVVYELLSTFPITEDTVIEVGFDKKIAFEVFFESAEISYEPDDISLVTLAKNNWEEASGQLLAAEDKDSANELIVEQFDLSENPYVGVTSELYTGLLTVRFDLSLLSEDTVLEQLNLSVDGKCQSYNIGKITLSNQAIFDRDDSLFTSCVAYTDLNATPTADGFFTVPDISAEVIADIVLQSITFSDDSILVEDVAVTKTMTDGQVFSFLWDLSEPLELKKGESVIFSINGKHPRMAHSIITNAQFYALFHYGGELVGKQQYVELSYRMRMRNPFQAYVHLVCGKDILSYYEDYLPAEDYWLEK